MYIYFFTVAVLNFPVAAGLSYKPIFSNLKLAYLYHDHILINSVLMRIVLANTDTS